MRKIAIGDWIAIDFIIFDDMYAFEEELRALHPTNRRVRVFSPKIGFRQKKWLM